jgi:hypothetical protein
LDKGRVLTYAEVSKYVRAHKLAGITMQQLRRLRQSWLSTAIYRNAPLRPKRYQSIGIHRLGLIQLDVAFYEGKNKGHDSGCIGFVIAVAPATGMLQAIPVKNKATETFEECIEELITAGIFPALHTIQSDRERALTSARFRQYILDEKHIRLHQLVTGSKAWSAERAIRTVKTQLSMVMKRHSESKRWLTFLQPIIEHHNQQPAHGTKYIAQDINDANFLSYLSERFGTPDVTMDYNSKSIDIKALAFPRWRKLLFKHQLKDLVIITRASDYTKKGGFEKKSRDGTYSSTIYTVTRAALRSNYLGILVPGRLSSFCLGSIR